MTRLAKEYKSINLSQGVPVNDYDDLWNECVSNQEGINWQYTHPAGTENFKSIIMNNYTGTKNLCVTETSGCTESLLCALLSFKEKGFESLIIFSPYYSYYTGFSYICGMKCYKIPLDIRLGRINWDNVKTICKKNSSVILVNTPHNPSGHTLTEEDEFHLINILDETKCAVLVDEVYRDFIYEGKNINYRILMKDNVLIASSWSKSLLGSGVRVGWLIGKKTIIDRCQYFRMHMSHCTPDILERGSIKLKQHTHFYKEKTKNKYKLRRDILFESLLKSGFEAIFPKAGHFIMARNGNSNKLNTFDQCMRLTKLAGVTPLPLDCFFHDDNPEKWIRFSFSVPTTQLEEAAKRLVKNKFLNN